MKAEILCVGTELLLGDTVNTNAAYISRQLAKIAVYVFHQSVVGDNEERLKAEIKARIKSCDVLIITGGLGPTYDDMTKEVAAEVFNKKLEMNYEALEKIKAYFERKGYEMPDNNRKQALIPENAEIIENKNGTAPGIIINENDKIVILLPGVPKEMKAMLDDTVIPYLAEKSDRVLVSKNIRIYGIGESVVESKLRDLMLSSKNPTVAPYAKQGEVLLRVTASAKDKEEAEAVLSPVVSKICSDFSDYVYGVDVPNIETALVNKLREKKKTIAVAESCTGGLVSKRITDVSGASSVFELAVCSYSDRIKHEILGVREETLKKFTAVSKEVAEEMAEGIKKLSGADIAVSVTGVAGPGDLSKDKPYGLVYVGFASKGNTEVKELRLGNENKNDRELIRNLSTKYALAKALKILERL